MFLLGFEPAYSPFFDETVVQHQGVRSNSLPERRRSLGFDITEQS